MLRINHHQAGLIQQNLSIECQQNFPAYLVSFESDLSDTELYLLMFLAQHPSTKASNNCLYTSFEKIGISNEEVGLARRSLLKKEIIRYTDKSDFPNPMEYRSRLTFFSSPAKATSLFISTTESFSEEYTTTLKFS